MSLRRYVAAPFVLWALAASGCADKEAAKQNHLRKGDALSAAGNYPEAILEYKNALTIDRKFGEAHYRLAEAYGRNADGRQALREYVRAADILTGRPDVQLRAASLLLAAQQFDSARKYAENALRIEKLVEAQIVLATAMAGLKDPAAASRELEEAMANAPGDARPYVSLGSINANLGKTNEAEAAFKKAIAIDPKSIEARLAIALYYWSASRLPDAEASIKSAIEIDRDDESANRLLATLYLRQNRSAEAETPLLRLTNRNDLLSTLSLADLYARTSRMPQARPLYEKVLGEESLHARAVTRLATLDYLQGKPGEAMTRVDAELTNGVRDPLVLSMKAQLLSKQRRVDEALDVAKKAAAMGPQSAIAQYTLGGVLMQRGERDAAIAALTEALKFDAQLVGPDAQLASLYLASGDNLAALTHARAAVQLQPDDPSVRLQLAAAFLATQDIPAAQRELRDLTAQHPGLPSVHSQYGEALMAGGNLADAAREYDKALAANPVDLRALEGRVAIDVKNGRPRDARARLARVIETSDSPDLLMLAGRFEQGMGADANAEKFLRQVLQKDPSRLEAYQLLGSMFVRQQRLDAARAEFEEVVKRRPDSIQASTMIGMILDAQQKPEESMKVYEAIVKSGRHAPVAANNLAWLFASRGERLDFALELAQAAKQGIPNSSEVDDTLGWVYYKKNMPTLAVKSLEASLLKDPHNVSYQFHLGLACAKAGQVRKARQLLQGVLERAPKSEGADEARKTLDSLKGIDEISRASGTPFNDRQLASSAATR